MVQSNTLYAPKTGLYLPGATGNYPSTPDHASLQVSNFSIIVDFKKLGEQTDYGYFVAKYNSSGNNREYGFGVLNDNKFFLAASEDGTSAGSDFIFFDSLFTDVELGKHIYAVTASLENVAVLWNKVNGFWQKIEEKPMSVASSIYNGSNSLIVGSDTTGNFLENITIYSAQIYNGIGDNSAPGLGTLVAEVDFSYPWANNKYTDATGKIWTINGSAWAWEYQDDPEDKYTPTPEIFGGDAYQLINDQINNSSSALHVLNGGNARGY